jgi:hypothetical protein
VLADGSDAAAFTQILGSPGLHRLAPACHPCVLPGVRFLAGRQDGLPRPPINTPVAKTGTDGLGPDKPVCKNAFVSWAADAGTRPDRLQGSG